MFNLISSIVPEGARKTLVILGVGVIVGMIVTIGTIFLTVD